MYDLDKVQPGQLITSKLIDAIIDAIVDLDNRLTALTNKVSALQGQASGPAIYGLSPNPAVVGQQLTVTGQNFQLPMSGDTVTLGSVPITQFLGTPSQTVFAFLVPNTLPNISLAGTPQTLSITNASGGPTATAGVTVQAAPILGALGILYDTGPTQNVITQNSAMTLGFTVSTQFPTTGGPFAIQVSASVGTASGWSIDFLDSNQNPTNSSTTTFNATGSTSIQTQKVWLQVTATTATATNANLVVTASCTAAGVQAAPAPTPNLALTYGQSPPVPDNRIRVSLATWATPTAQNNTAPPVTVKAGQALTMSFSVTTNAIGTYQAQFSMPSGWTPADSTKLTQTLPANTTGATQTGLPVPITYTAPSTPGSATLTLTVQETTAPTFAVTFTQQVTVTS
jgi:hypothetical protein